MPQTYYTILTDAGARYLANAQATGTNIKLKQMAVGDGGGSIPQPNSAQTALINQKYIADLNSLEVDSNNASQYIAELVIREDIGDFWIRETGLYTDDGTLFAVGNCPETYKPVIASGASRTQTIRMVVIIGSTQDVTLTVDPSIVLATKNYVDNTFLPIAAKATTAQAQAGIDDVNYMTALKVAEKVNLGVPIGFVSTWFSETPPTNWLIADGSDYLRADYPELYAVLGTKYNQSGDDSTVFRVPDLRARYIRFADLGLGRDTNLDVGYTHGDAIRNITAKPNTGYRKGWLSHGDLSPNDSAGAINIIQAGNNYMIPNGTNFGSWFFWEFDASRVVPTAAENRVYSIVALPIIRYA